MSAFVVGAECINRVIYGLRLMEMPREAGESESEFGRRLLALNMAAVNQRYPTMAEADTREYGWRFDYEYREPGAIDGVPSAVAGWKALECLIYQCSEGNIPETALYQLLEKYKQAMESRILQKRNVGRRQSERYNSVWDLPEIQRAPWGD